MELRNEILMRATELGNLLAKTAEVSAYKSAEKAMLEHPAAKARLDIIKQHGNAGSDQEELEKLFRDLDNIQEVKAFQSAQHHVQALLQTVSQIVADSVLTP